MSNINNKFKIFLELLLIVVTLFIGFNMVILLKLKENTELKTSILLRQSIEDICGTSRIVNSKIANYHKGRFTGTYSTDYIDFNLSKPLTKDEFDNVQVLFADTFKKEFNFGEDLTTKIYNIKNVEINNNQIGVLSSVVEFNSNLPFGGTIKFMKFFLVLKSNEI